MENLSAALENARTLSQIVGVDEPVAAEMLSCTISISFDPHDTRAVWLASYIGLLLGRTVRKVSLNVTEPSDILEIVLGHCAKRTRLQLTVYVGASFGQLKIATSGRTGEFDESFHPALLMLASCYVSAFVLRISVLRSATGLPLRDPMLIDLETLPGYSRFADLSPITMPVGTFLAGAGAIGNAFIWALQAFEVNGTLTICDPDVVSPGNLNRCVLFKGTDVGQLKAETLAREARKILPNLTLRSEPVELSKVRERSGRQWLRQLIIAVDSRRTRRRLQREIPGEVYDASTTGVQELVLHFNRQPDVLACLGCIYKEDEGERLHEAHVAEALGVDAEDVQNGWITPAAAQAIASKYVTLQPEQLVGIAYDTLFKQLCGQQALTVEADKQVLAPFAFVSALAGIYLAIEFVLRNQSSHSERFNYWRASPWAEPNPRAMTLRPQDPQCGVCSDPVYNRVARALWEFRVQPAR